MLIPEDSLPYLTGQKFSSGLAFQLEKGRTPMIDRFTWFENQVRGKAILDVGCVDHNVETIERKRRAGVWLHERLRRVASSCIGMDTCAQGIEYIKSMPGYVDADVLCGDLFERANEIDKKKIDSLVLGEVLEHVDDPVSFLRHIRETFGSNIKELLISVPNAMSLENFIYGLDDKECINSDHRYWFTPYTISKVCIRAGWEVHELRLVTSFVFQWRGIRNYLKGYLLEKHPVYRDTITIRLGLT